MAIPVPSNTTCDIYRLNGGPPGSPAVAGVPVYLKPDWVAGQEHGDREVSDLVWTHLMLVDYSTDIRDYYNSQSTAQANWNDNVFIPDQTGTKFRVVFVEVVNFGLSSVHKRVYLDRQTPAWPTNEL